MTATNQQMTSEQLADLSTLSAQLLCKAEANDDRDTAVMAYAVQRACSELEESRREFTAANATIHNLELKLEQVVAENDRAVKAVTVFSNVTHDITEIICDELGQERVAEIVAAYNDLGNMPNTDAYLAEVRAQAVDEIAELYFTLAAHEANRSIADSWRESARFARDHAAQLRQGAEQ
ncbi:hypothetical protein [Kluyvera sp. EC_51]|uniref:hypothetical protein n=1 Tax=Kluyvera TaxID=579 RepID=UPI001C701D3B|nr:hypothetical protein [Kluyvera sp. EC_51]MBW9460943.1 hypothetical protein [Kluyvera sp. EC_51]